MSALEIENARETLSGARRIERIIRRVAGRVVEGSGYEVMELLAGGGIDLSTNEIAARLAIPVSVVSRSLNALAGARCVERKWTSAGNGHAKKVSSLTPLGRQMLGEIRAALITDDAEVLAAYDDNDDDAAGW
jgi:DNA-binding PadR family transcriptional regulator